MYSRLVTSDTRTAINCREFDFTGNVNYDPGLRTVATGVTPIPLPAEFRLIQLRHWDPNRSYRKSPPSYIHYSIKWKRLLNNGVTRLANDTG